MRAAAPFALVVALAGCLTNLTPTAEDLAPEDLATPLGPEFVRALALSAREASVTGEPTTVYAMRVADFLTGTAHGLFPPRPYEVLLRPSAVLTTDSRAEIDGVAVDFPAVEVYDGEVKDVAGSYVRLVVTPEWVRGSISMPDYFRGQRNGDFTALIRYNLNGNLPYGTLEPPAPGGAGGGFANMPMDTVEYDAPGWEEQECISLIPTALEPRVLGTGTALDAVLPADVRDRSALTARIVMDADAYALQMLGDHTFPVLVAMLAETDAVYEKELGVRLELALLHAHTDPRAIGNWTEGIQHDNLAKYWNGRADVDRDVVHLIGGEDAKYGVANCIGGAGIPEVAYTFSPLPWEQQTPVFHTVALAHELGHIFNAHHHYGNHVESGGRGATLMIQGYTPGARFTFGTLERATIRGWAEEYLDAGMR